MTDFTDIAYLAKGNARQREAYRVLRQAHVFEKLQPFDPILTGTVPLTIDIAGSDLDVICYFEHAHVFQTALAGAFHTQPGFIFFTPKVAGAIAATFQAGEFVIEIFGQTIPTRRQAAYRHMLVEHRVLLEKGEAFRQQIIELKKQGYKTEPAFGKLLGIEGNVYEALLDLE